MGYEIVLIDADDTLFDYNKGEAYALEATLNSFSIVCDYNTYLKRYREINKKIWLELEDGRITKELLRTERFRQLFSIDGIEVDIERFSEVYLKNLSLGSQLIDGAYEVCNYLGSKYKVIIVTNGIKDVQQPRIKNSKIKSLIEHVVVSEEAGCSKPHTGIFQYAFDLAGHKDKATAIMIGDSLTSDIQGGINFGIDTCWYNHSKSSNNSEIIPKYEIHELGELRKIL